MTLSTLRPTEVPLRSVALIEASAGTGKTFTIATLYVRLVLEGRAGRSYELRVRTPREAS